MKPEEVQENCLYYYSKGHGWCRHSIVYTIKHKDKLVAINTYGDSEFKGYISQDDTCYDVENIAEDMEFIMKLEDIKAVSSDEFDHYDWKDKVYIPIGMRSPRYLVNKNANKVKENIEWQLKDKIESAKWDIKSAQRNIERWEKELKELNK